MEGGPDGPPFVVYEPLATADKDHVPRALKIALLIVTLALAFPGAAGASTAAKRHSDPLAKSHLLYFQDGSAQALVVSVHETPLHFHSTGAQAIAAAYRSPVVQRLLRRMHSLQVIPYVWRGQHPYWYVTFLHQGRIVADADVTRYGRLTAVWTGPQATAPYTQGNFSWALTSALVLVPAGLLFLLAFFDPRRLRRLSHLDGLALLAFLVSYLLLNGAHLEAAVWLVYPPLLYLLARMLGIGFGGGGSSPGRLAPLLSTRTLLIGLPLLIVARLVLSFVAHQEIDVGYESVIGAARIVHHLPIYWQDPYHGDTYGPITYLLYVPFELVFPWKGNFTSVHAVDAAAILFDLGTMAGLFFLGRRLRTGREGTRLGLVLTWAWAACPFTIINLVVHTNDGLIAMLSVLALLVIASPLATGAVLGLATAAKFSPASLLPLLAAPRKRGVKGAALCVISCAVVVVVAVYSWLPPGGFAYFWHRTLGFQLHRYDVFSPWALHPGLHPVQTLLEVFAVLLVLAVAFYPRERSLARVCALAGAVTIAIQLPAQHWFYYYIAWFLPFVFVAFLARTSYAAEASLAPSELPVPAAAEPAPREPALAGA